MSRLAAPRPQYFRGEVWWADLDPVRGREQAGRRPVLIVSDDGFNLSQLDMAIVVPLTKTPRGWRSRVPLRPPEGGIIVPSEIQCDQLRTIAMERLLDPLGQVTERTMGNVAAVLRLLLRL